MLDAVSEEATTQSESLGAPTAAFLSLVVALFAAWGAFWAVGQATGYEGRAAVYEARLLELDREDIRLTSDGLYHRPYHEPENGKVMGLGQAVRDGYRPCPICKPTIVPRMAQPSNMLGYAASAATFALVLAGAAWGLGVGMGGLLPERSARERQTPIPKGSQLSELSDHLLEVADTLEVLLRGIAGVGTTTLQGALVAAVSLALVEWAAHWTERGKASAKDLRTLAGQMSLRGSLPGAAAVGDPRAFAEYHARYGKALQQLADRETRRFSSQEAKRVVEQLARDGGAEGAGAFPESYRETSRELCDLAAKTVAFMRDHYARDGEGWRRVVGRE